MLARDIAEICSDIMASHIGVILVLFGIWSNLFRLIQKYYTESGIPKRALESNICSICTNQIMVLNNEESIFESTFNLPCGHMLVDYSFVFMILKNN